MSDFNRTTQQDERLRKDLAKRRSDYYGGDTWTYWIGPLPNGSMVSDNDAREAVRKAFQRTNKVKECVDRIVNTLVAKAPHWTFEGSSGTELSEAQNQELTEGIQEWFKSVWAVSQQVRNNTSGGNTPIWEAARDLVVQGRGYLRLWMPARLRTKGGFCATMLSAVPPGGVSVNYDDDGFPSEYRISTAKGAERHLLAESEPGTGDFRIRIYHAGASESEAQDFEQLGPGEWLIAEMVGQSAIGQDVMDAQNAINLALTMQARSLVQNGFVERILTNAQIPGEWITDDSAPSGQRFVAAPEGLVMGPGTTSFIQGQPLTNEYGNITGYSTPGVNYSQPVDISTYSQAIANATEIIYLSMGMGHLLAADTGQIAALSRQILQQDADVRSSQYERAIVGALEQVLRVLTTLYGYDVRPTVELRKSGAFVSPEAKTQIIAEYNAGLISKATAIARLGSVEDVDAELAQIESEGEADQNRGAKSTIKMLGTAIDDAAKPDAKPAGKGGNDAP